MIKIVFSEVESPTSQVESTDLNRSSAVRVVNTSKSPSTLNVVSKDSTKSITIIGGESLIIKKHLDDRIFCSTKTVRIAGVSIY